MPKTVCASCLTFSINKIVKSPDDMKPSWLQKYDYLKEFISNQTDFRLTKPKSYDTAVDLEMKKMANRKILYWAAHSKSNEYDLSINDAKTAYGDFSNFGIAKCDNNGKVKVHFDFPQLYSTIRKGEKKPQTFHHHFHFVISNKDETGWLSQVYTKIVIKNLSFSELESKRKHNKTFLLNTLPCEYYAQDHIPNSYNLYYKQIKKMSVAELQNWFLNVVKTNYPELHKLLKNKTLSINEIPIVCYCAHKDCNASELALEELAKKGFVNCCLYEGGMKEFNQKHKK